MSILKPMPHSFLFSGIADEAGRDLPTQIRAHRELGWKHIEIRAVDGVQFTDLTEAAFESACELLTAAGLHVSAFASGIANWATKITDPFERSVEILERAIPRMQRLGTRFIRVMSYPNNGLTETEWRSESIRRMRELGKLAEAGGIVLAVENCDGWASTSPDAYAEYFGAINSPAVKAVYDTGNPASHAHRNTLEWWAKARPHLGYIHIKAHTVPADGSKGVHTWPDTGESCIRETLSDLLVAGYDGFVSIEPHLGAIAHTGQGITDAEAAYRTYVEYGTRLTRLAGTIASELGPLVKSAG
jgi:sugar phosphate isomerase/epimerase